MDGLIKTNEKKEATEDFSFYNYFIPFTTSKAIHWIVIIGIIVYINCIFNNFLGDDKLYIINYLPTHSISIANAFGSSIFNTDGQYRPVSALLFSILYALFGTNPFFYHIIQITLHIVCALFLFILFRKFFSLGITFFCVLLFLIHPLQVESVAYISQTDSQIYFMTGIIAFMLSMKKKISIKTISLIGFLLLISLLTKETGILFIFLILIYSLLFNRKYILKFLYVSIISLAIYFCIRIFIGHVGFDTRLLSPIAKATLPQRLFTIPDIFFYYIKSLFFPVFLSYDQQWVISNINLTNFYIPLFIDVLFITVLVKVGLYILKNRRENFKIYIFFCMWFLLGVGMVIQIYPLDATVADRWFYIPLAGIAGIIGVCIQSFPKINPNMRKVSIIGAVCIIVLFSIRTIVRNTNWYDAITLFSHDIKVSDNSNLDENLAYELILANRNQEGIIFLEKSVQKTPNSSGYYDLGYLYEQSHNYQKAIYYYTLSLDQKDRSYGYDEVIKNTYDGMARIESFHDKPEKAKIFLESAIKLYPQDGSYWAYLAIVDYSLKDQEDALIAAGKAKYYLHDTSADLLYSRIADKKPLNLIQ